MLSSARREGEHRKGEKEGEWVDVGGWWGEGTDECRLGQIMDQAIKKLFTTKKQTPDKMSLILDSNFDLMNDDW
jgi:hypothetical protein